MLKLRNTYPEVTSDDDIIPVDFLIAESDFLVCDNLADWVILGALDVIGFGTSIIRTPGAEGTVPENTS